MHTHMYHQHNEENIIGGRERRRREYGRREDVKGEGGGEMYGGITGRDGERGGGS